MSIKKNDSLSKSELIIKLEAILSLHNKAIAIKRKMNNFVPEDNYERKVVVPGFPGKYEDEEDGEYFESAVRHEEKERDLDEIPDEVKEHLAIEFASNITDVLNKALVRNGAE